MFEEITRWVGFNGCLGGVSKRVDWVFFCSSKASPVPKPLSATRVRLSSGYDTLLWNPPRNWAIPSIKSSPDHSRDLLYQEGESVRMNEEMADRPEVIPRVDKGNPAHLQRIVIRNPEYSYSHLKM